MGREKSRQERGLLRGQSPFQLMPLNSPTELAQAMSAVGSGLQFWCQKHKPESERGWGPEEAGQAPSTEDARPWGSSPAAPEVGQEF